MVWILAILAPVIGSFLGVLALRLADGRPVLFARSECDACGHVLGPADLVPLISWVARAGRCRHCGAKIGWFHPAMEISAIVVVVWAATQTAGLTLLASVVLGWTLLALAVTDWRALLLPDALTICLLLSGLLAVRFFDPGQFIDHLIGAVTGFGLFAALAIVYRVVRGREGLGFGDAKLMAGAGAWLGWLALPTVILFGAGFGLLFALVRSALGYSLGASDRLPLGTFLAVAIWLVWLYGPLVPG